MLIKDYAFIDPGDGTPRPMLWVRVINPHTNICHTPVLALVDTGADECAFPADVAVELGHNLKSVEGKPIATAGGETWGYPHTSQVEILERQPDGRYGNRVLHTIFDTPINFVIDLHTFILGTKQFLSNFVLTVDYLRQVFSIQAP